MEEDICKEIAFALDEDDICPMECKAIMRQAQLEIEQLRVAVTRYCDKFRMGTIEPMPVQQAVDRAFMFTE